MSDGIEVTGWDEMVKYIEGLEISTQLENKALKNAGNFLTVKVKDYIKENVELTGYTRTNTKGKLKTVGGDKVYSVALEGWDAKYIEYGTSKSKEHAGFFVRTIEDNLEGVQERILDTISEVFD